MSTTYNYYATTVAPSVCIDPNAGVYSLQIVVMNAATSGASTQFWYDGMPNATSYSSLPSAAVVPPTSFTVPGASAMTPTQFAAALTPQIQPWVNGLVARLQSKSATVQSVSAGATVPVQVTY